MDKDNLRQNMKKTLKEMSLEDKEDQNNNIFTIRQKQLFPKYKNRAIYISLTNEVDTKKIIDYIWHTQSKCLLPIQQEDRFFFTEISPDTQYYTNKNGILHPVIQKESKHIPDAILVPGLAFTLEGVRLGRGQGRYDKLLVQCPNIIKVGVCHTQQIQEKIPKQSHDQVMDMILSTQLYFTS